MGRLIDADLLKESMKKFAQEQLLSEYQCSILVTDVLDDIDNQPTAYDVDKVVEQLEEERDLGLKSTGKYYHKPLMRAHYHNAISIVKRGGQE